MATTIVDELIVKIGLDASEYKKVDKTVDKVVGDSERKLKKADQDREKRMKQSQQTVKQFGASLKGLALTIGSVLGVGGGAAGIIGAVVALTNFETGLRRATVSTGLSNREMQAWGSAARRLGADADAGAQAIADLAREQKQFAITGNAPTMQALARLGINVNPDSNIIDVIEQAQQAYRGAAPGQKSQIESGLAAQGVSNDLILLIKSEKNVREEFARSFAESANENRAALDRVSDMLETVKNAGINLAATLADLLQPAAEQLGHWLSGAAQDLSAFNDRVQAAGGGVDGFMRVLDEERPGLAATLRFLGDMFQKLGEIIDVSVYGYQQLYKAVKMLSEWIDNKLSAVFGEGPSTGKTVAKSIINPIGALLDSGAGGFISDLWKDTVKEARAKGAAPIGTITGSSPSGRRPAGAGVGTGAGGGFSSASKPTAQTIMDYLINQGMTVDQAAAVAANLQRESGFDPRANNPEGGGQGARGLAQWRGGRIDAFRARFGTTPDRAPWQQQLDFLRTDPYERSKLAQSFAAGGSAAQQGAAFSRIFEAHGKIAEDVNRGNIAARLAQSYTPGSGATAAGGAQVHISGPVTVQANNPQDFIGGIQRVSGVSNYNSAVR